MSLYAASKRANEMMAHSYAHLFQTPSTGLRFFTAYGPWGRPDMALFIFTKKIIAGEPIEVYNKGQMLRDFTFIDDLVEGIFLSMLNPPNANPGFDHQNPIPSESSAPYRMLNIGNNNPVVLIDFVREIENALGKSICITGMPRTSHIIYHGGLICLRLSYSNGGIASTSLIYFYYFFIERRQNKIQKSLFFNGHQVKNKSRGIRQQSLSIPVKLF
jgi:nucleoside-diphosphate-sugar epimerase